ncbi:MAG TPA: hypothetical protein VGL40_03100 [Bacillota bacterium]
MGGRLTDPRGEGRHVCGQESARGSRICPRCGLPITNPLTLVCPRCLEVLAGADCRHCPHRCRPTAER